MLVIRPVRCKDLDDIHRLAVQAGEGMTSLPTDRPALASIIQNAEASFARQAGNNDDNFLLVMEDASKNQVVGTSAIHARTGSRQAFYSYRLMSITHYSHSLGKETRAGLLHLTNDYTDYSEVGTLFLDPDYRGNGHWLSRSRYMLMAQYPDRFASDVIAELRGVVDELGESPVWNAIGQHFFKMSYAQADQLCGTGSNQFITELMPKYPIYTSLLPPQARAALGQTHKDTQRAMDLLLAEGFVFEQLIDIFDGGPLVRATIKQIKSVMACRQVRVLINDKVVGQKMICANCHLDQFRLVFQTAIYLDGTVSITASTAAALDVHQGETIMIILDGER
ncbi:MAG: arginine N-succinyltransferase [Pseudomonadales bacterium]|nr:arginine N-succinyltransferase [Pseudomonadales bacterium]